jgi:hypothetical protein
MPGGLHVDTRSEISQRGFRRWYEGQLLRGHLHLLLLILGVLALLGGLEALSRHPELTDRAQLVACMLAAVGISAYALRVFLRSTGYAEYLARQADCPHCRAYARWDVRAADADAAGSLLRVSCQACGQGWSIHL